MAAADGKHMATVLRVAAMCAAACVALSFVMFIADQSEEGSTNQIRTVEGVDGEARSESAIDRPAPDSATERRRESEHGGVRELIDDGNDVLTAPFAGLAGSDDVWVERLVAGALAGLLFGLGGMLLANFIPRQARRETDWREATG